eukprot:gnl/TRDRNA2_/TRDRNA2_176896_c0_seq1.p1 gnl/TRDRNA2_/TRDRNA2_176896_c0~~gnl/TRDRNA2_/TRDRNA2_176896_c0_seq1.p1  ORF type:complete len:347 (-),score=-17.18 gnl/TRDRNA2_/TRDRNA2_176896_c0_seq1:924-1964(-)
MVTLSESILRDLKEISEDFSAHSMGDNFENKKMIRHKMCFKTKKHILDICTLTSSRTYERIIKRINNDLETLYLNKKKNSDEANEKNNFALLIECNQLVSDIDNEITLVNNFNRDLYRSRFPELELLVHNPIDYARVVQAIGKETDISQVDLNGVLPTSIAMVVTVTASTTTGRTITESKFKDLLHGCSMALKLDADKSKILSYIEEKMKIIAPNLSALVGSTVGAKMICLAGGVSNLSKIPACNIQGLGAKQNNGLKNSIFDKKHHSGSIFDCEIIQNTPPGYRNKVAKLVSTKCALLVRIDASGRNPCGNLGCNFRKAVVKKNFSMARVATNQISEGIASPRRC